jgi:CRP-like cAMP-binding protein
MTRKEIANSLGASAESVIRIMSEWSKRGLIETHDQHIKLLQVNKIIEEMDV